MKLNRSLLFLALCWGTAAGAQTPVGPDSGAVVDRELVVRFTRAYGMAKEAFDTHADAAPSENERNAMLRQPEELTGDLRQEVSRILDLNGLQKDEWKMMFARMEADDDLRRRVESLSTPFE